MELIKKVKAYRALTEMMKETWEFDFIYPLAKLKQEIEGDYDFFRDEELKLVAKYGKKEADGSVFIDENGSFSFADENCKASFQQKHAELAAMDTDFSGVLSLTAPPKICGGWLAELMPFCDFKQEVSHE